MKVLLLYPPEQQWPGCIVKPNGSLAYPYLGGALRDIGVEAYVYDATVGDKNDNTDDFFGKPTKLPSGKLRTGVTDERILEEAPPGTYPYGTGLRRTSVQHSLGNQLPRA